MTYVVIHYLQTQVNFEGNIVNLKEYMQKTLGSGEVLTVIYNGGSNPGGVRMLIPKKIDGDNTMAVDLASNRVKKFRIDKMKLVFGSEDVTDYVAEASTADIEPENIREAVTPYLSTLKKKGWHVCVEDNAIGLFRKHKDDTPLKEPDVYMLFIEYSEKKADSGEPGFDSDPHYWSTRNREFIDETALFQRQRPLYVKSNHSRETAHAFKSFLNATSYFMKLAQEAAED